VLKAVGRFEEAEAAARRALAISPDEPGAMCNLAAALQAEGRLDEAGRCFRQSLAVAPDQPIIRSCALVCEQYRPDATLGELAAAHAEWDRRHAAPLAAAWRPHRNTPDPERPLRLGFVSPDFGAHPVGYFLEGVLENLDPQAWHTLCYSDRLKIDEMTARLQAAAGTWHDVRGVSDQDLAERIRNDRVDILFDLAGHTAGNRLLVFARKPAPIQVTWLGYVGTTGLSAIDYLLADRHQVAEGLERYYREQVLRMPEGYVCYLPPPEAPEVGPLPAAQNGRVTFASFNNPAKINRAVAAVWAEILRRVPGSRLILKYCGYCAPKTHRRFLEIFAAQGIGESQLELRDWSARRELLALYNEVDLGLDPFPYGGGLTTCEALWMGVPVITCPGQTFGSRHSLSHLSSVGLTGTIARDLDDYVALAARWAEDLPRLGSVRAGLRPQMAASTLCDSRRFTADFAAVLRGVWRKWCRR